MYICIICTRPLGFEHQMTPTWWPIPGVPFRFSNHRISKYRSSFFHTHNQNQDEILLQRSAPFVALGCYHDGIDGEKKNFVVVTIPAYPHVTLSFLTHKNTRQLILPPSVVDLLLQPPQQQPTENTDYPQRSRRSCRFLEATIKGLGTANGKSCVWKEGDCACETLLLEETNCTLQWSVGRSVQRIERGGKVLKYGCRDRWLDTYHIWLVSVLSEYFLIIVVLVLLLSSLGNIGYWGSDCKQW